MCVAIKLARFLHLIWQVQRGRKSPENGSITPPRRAIFKGLRRAAVLFVLMVLEFSIALDENSGTTTGRVTACLHNCHPRRPWASGTVYPRRRSLTISRI
ncbi:hypothetical protein AGR8A_Cc70103 [Agrobacterium fabrum str. J-07]|nr:hypothetical protein AGR8A_Cc70103 [Agrobacterium fabrum str. J-07]